MLSHIKHALIFLFFVNGDCHNYVPAKKRTWSERLRLTLRSYSNFGYINNNT